MSSRSGKRLLVSVDRGGGGEHHPGARIPRREQDVERASNIDVRGPFGLSDRTRNRPHRPLVEDDVAPLSGGPYGGLIPQVGLHEPHVGNVRQVLQLAVRQVVQAHDLVSVRRRVDGTDASR